MSSEPTVEDFGALADLCHHRWVIPVIVAIGGGGQRFAVLAGRLGVARQTLRRALAAAVERGLVRRNPGYGHPLRPEYCLTVAGARLEPICRGLDEVLAGEGSALAGRKWTLPILAAVGEGRCRFSEIAERLPAATPRALSNGLAELTSAGWLERELVDEHPPAACYRAGAVGRSLATLATRLMVELAAIRHDRPPGE